MLEHEQKELMKLHGIERSMAIKSNWISKWAKYSAKYNSSWESGSSKSFDRIRTNTVHGNKSYVYAAMSCNAKNGITKKVIVFGDSIIRQIKVRDLNQQVKNGNAKFKSSPGYNSKEMLHALSQH